MGAGGPRGATPSSRSERAAVRRYPLVQGKEKQLHFAGAAMKRYQGKRNPNKMVAIARGHKRADILKPYSQ